MRKPGRSVLDAYDMCNRAAAEIIAADPARYQGIMAEWAAMILGGFPMIYLRHDRHTQGADASLQSVRTRLAAPNGDGTADVPEVQEQVLEQGTGARDQAGTAGGGARC
jgi:hypothetical protein